MPKGRQTNTEYWKNIGQRLRLLREQAGVTQVEISKILGLTFQQVQKYESGSNRIPLDNLLSFLNRCGSTIDEFLASETQPKERIPGYATLFRCYADMPEEKRAAVLALVRTIAKA